MPQRHEEVLSIIKKASIEFSSHLPIASFYRSFATEILALRISGWSDADVAGLLSSFGRKATPETVRIYGARFRGLADEAMAEALAATAPKPPSATLPKPITKDSILLGIREDILLARQAGKSWETISAELRSAGLSIQATSLRQRAGRLFGLSESKRGEGAESLGNQLGETP